MSILLNILKWYNPTNVEKIKEKKETLINAERLYNNRNNVIKVFKKGIFLQTDGFEIEQEQKKNQMKNQKKNQKRKSKIFLKNLINVLRKNPRT